MGAGEGRDSDNHQFMVVKLGRNNMKIIIHTKYLHWSNYKFQKFINYYKQDSGIYKMDNV